MAPSHGMRFGNHLAALNHAVSAAAGLGVKRVFHPGHELLKDNFNILGVQVKNMKLEEPGGRGLISRFLCGNTLQELIQRGLKSKGETQFSMGGKFLNALLLPPSKDFAISEVENGERHVFHIRSGDLFLDDIPHPKYGQPPAAFYEKSLLHSGLRKVQFIAEDLLNPVLLELKRRLERRNVESDWEKSDIGSDYRTMVAARHLTVGRGTFAKPAISMPKPGANVYGFHKFRHWAGYESSQISFLNSSDKIGDFNKSVGTIWANSLYQQSLMVDYEMDMLTEFHPE